MTDDVESGRYRRALEEIERLTEERDAARADGAFVDRYNLRIYNEQTATIRDIEIKNAQVVFEAMDAIRRERDEARNDALEQAALKASWWSLSAAISIRAMKRHSATGRPPTAPTPPSQVSGAAEMKEGEIKALRERARRDIAAMQPPVPTPQKPLAAEMEKAVTGALNDGKVCEHGVQWPETDSLSLCVHCYPRDADGRLTMSAAHQRCFGVRARNGNAAGVWSKPLAAAYSPDWHPGDIDRHKE